MSNVCGVMMQRRQGTGDDRCRRGKVRLMLRWDASWLLMAQAMDFRMATRSRSGYQPHGQGFALWFFALIVRAHGTAGCGGPGGRTAALGNAIRDSLP